MAAKKRGVYPGTLHSAPSQWCDRPALTGCRSLSNWKLVRSKTMTIAATSATAVTPDPALSDIFQRQLAQLVAQQEAAGTPKELATVKSAMFKLFLDAIDLGLLDEAQLILKQVNVKA